MNPMPGGPGGPTITFNNDVPGGPSTNLPVSDATAEMVEQAVRESGMDINVNSTTGGKHGSKSRHPKGMACDINEVDGKRVDDPSNSDSVRKLQEILNQQSNIRENFGPSQQTKTSADGTVTQRPDMAPSHQTHVHASGQR